ncbi:hypothetical protein EWM64_g1393 [Hericium alpestre]|uniref:Uncharacterized protein n=1 Tax=Hericium alpestre TaxID=135208 RepID=A0A4Z0A7A8_9AGAM|nr:hypothetical protein EWM64_g1393 [Hericium alpestre]
MPKPLMDEPESRSLPPLPSFNSQPDLTTQATLRAKNGVSLAMKRTSSTSPGTTPPGSRQSTLTVSAPKKRLSVIGTASSHGRLYKVLGDFFLLAARTEDALIWYTEAIALFKSPSDAVWHASALEGQATIAVLDAWSLGQGLQSSFSNSREPWSEVQEKLNQAVALYAKGDPHSESEHQQELLAYLYTTAVLRQTSLLFATWSAKGWGPLAFTALLHPGPTPYLPPTLSHSSANPIVDLERLSSISGITRAQIAAVLAQAHGPWLLHLSHRERIGILEAIAAMYSSLGYHRKEAYILREVIGCILDLIVCGREELGSSWTSPYDLPSTSNSQLGDKGAVGRKGNESSEGNESILNLVKYVCKAHGINLEAVALAESSSFKENNANGQAELKLQDVEKYDALSENADDPYGWPELQIGIIREALAVAEALPNSLAAAQFGLSALRTLQPVLSEEDQFHFYSTAARALSTAHRRGDKRLVEYWSGQPVVSIELLPVPSVRLLVENPSTLLTANGINALPRLTDPFLYNPRRSMMAQGNTLVVKDELVEFVVTLRNPYVFDLEIQTLALSTSGVPFESKPIPVTIPSNSYHSVAITGKATSTGELIIRGCHVQIAGGASREFILPLSTSEEEDRKSRRRSTLACEVGRSKYSGLDSRPWEKTGKRQSVQRMSKKSSTKIVSLHFMEVKVVPEQPLLRIRWSSLTHGALMLYDGEMSSIRLTLENVSSLPIDFLRLTFDDSTIVPAQQALSEGELSVFDTYETEYELIHRPAFSWNQEQHASTIPPVTVYHMLECHRMDILPFSHGDIDNSQEERQTSVVTPADVRKALLNVGEEDGWCLFSIDVRNTYGLPFEVEFVPTDVPTATATCLIAPGSTSRIVLPLKKILLSEEVTSKPIPTLSDRQFVVTKSSLTTAEEKAQRELFWYREELFKCIKGTWREAGGARSGDLYLRQQRMTLPMLEALRTETARVHMSLMYREGDDEPSWQAVDRKRGNYLPRPYEFVYLRTRITNLSFTPLVLTVDFNMEPVDYVIAEGTLADVPVGRLASGESFELETALFFVACGRFELMADIRILGGNRDESRVGVGQLTAIVVEQ